MTPDVSVDVSVIVPTYNRGPALRRTLDCLAAQSPAPREIIVVDQSDQPDPTTQQMLGALSAQGIIRLVRQEIPNAQRARNHAIGEARGEVLLFLDDDVEMKPDLVGAHWANYADPEIAAVAGYYLEPSDSPTDVLPPECDHPTTGWLHVPHSYTKRIASHQFPSCNGSVRRSVARRMGGFDENFRWTLLDDTDFACRLRRLGVKAVHDPSAALMHLKEPSGGRRPTREARYIIADRRLWFTWLYFYLMNFGIRGLPTLGVRFRRSVLRRPLLVRPWYLAGAFAEFVLGAAVAAAAIMRGRRLATFPTTP
ncbi:MAG: Beta-monoglucosyldiacylglycerol synthase [Gemmatimonadetes bacterium]|nr:Beta-monoglucosyldiacylglycerol synthase [Gemmatimonadota bacterium]